MRFLRVYARVLALLGGDLRIAGLLAGANLIVAGLQFLDPVLFGLVVTLLSHSDRMTTGQFWSSGAGLLAIWGGIGLAGILCNIFVSVQTERLSHRHRIAALGQYFQHVLNLPAAFHGDTQSGRLIKVMLTGTDALFGTWLVFFRDQFATFLSAFVLLPLTLLLNWRLALVLIALVVIFVGVTALVVRKTEAGQRQVERYNSSLAGTAQDALTNVVVVQSFTRLAAEVRQFGEIAEALIRHQFPVLNWWALVNVMTRASSTLAVITIVTVGAWLHVHGQATVGQIVSFMGIAMLLIGRLETAASFVSSLFFKMPGTGPVLRGAGRQKHGAGASARPHAVGAARGSALRQRLLRLRLRPQRADGAGFYRPSRPLGGIGGPHRRRQDHGDGAAAAAVGPQRGAYHNRRPGPA